MFLFRINISREIAIALLVTNLSGKNSEFLLIDPQTIFGGHYKTVPETTVTVKC